MANCSSRRSPGATSACSPQWYNPSHRIAYWDVFGHPAAKPRYARGIPETWWYDRDKAAKLERPG